MLSTRRRKTPVPPKPSYKTRPNYILERTSFIDTILRDPVLVCVGYSQTRPDAKPSAPDCTVPTARKCQAKKKNWKEKKKKKVATTCPLVSSFSPSLSLSHLPQKWRNLGSALIFRPFHATDREGLLSWLNCLWGGGCWFLQTALRNSSNLYWDRLFRIYYAKMSD